MTMQLEMNLQDDAALGSQSEAVYTPAIRFKGFSGAWEVKELGEIGSTYGGLSGKTRNDFGHGEGRFVTYMNVFSNPISDESLVEPVELDLKQNEIKQGDVFFTTSSELPEEVGMSSVWIGEASNVYLNSFCFGYRPNYEINYYYLAFMLRSSPFRRKMAFLAQGISRYNISKKKVMDITVSIPDLGEQAKIGQLFQQLDSLIAQHQHKHTKLLNLKQALLQKMFPKQGASVPEVRFQGFSGDWEVKALGNLSDIVRGASPRPIEDPKWFDTKSNVGWLRIRDVSEQDGRIHHLEQRISKAGEEKTRVIHEPHLLLSIAASVGKPVINYVSTGVHDGFLIFLKPSFNQEFLFQWLKSYEKEWQKHGQPGSQLNLNSDIVKNQNILIPEMEEQTKIGQLFQQLDHLINQQHALLTKLSNLKQAYLAKMFI